VLEGGAAIVHIHVREPETRKGQPAAGNTSGRSSNVIRDAKTDVLLNLTTGMGGRSRRGRRRMDETPRRHGLRRSDGAPRARAELHPDICSLDSAA